MTPPPDRHHTDYDRVDLDLLAVSYLASKRKDWVTRDECCLEINGLYGTGRGAINNQARERYRVLEREAKATNDCDNDDGPPLAAEFDDGSNIGIQTEPVNFNQGAAGFAAGFDDTAGLLDRPASSVLFDDELPAPLPETALAAATAGLPRPEPARPAGDDRANGLPLAVEVGRLSAQTAAAANSWAGVDENVDDGAELPDPGPFEAPPETAQLQAGGDESGEARNGWRGEAGFGAGSSIVDQRMVASKFNQGCARSGLGWPAEASDGEAE
jgi:hypothetical protein